MLEPHTQWLRNIRRDVGASTDFYDRYYLPCLHRFAAIVQPRPYGQEGEYTQVGGAIEAGLKRTAMAMKLRLGALLPAMRLSQALYIALIIEQECVDRNTVDEIDCQAELSEQHATIRSLYAIQRGEMNARSPAPTVL